MPHTIEQLGIATVAIAVALVGAMIAQRRWPNDDPTDTLVLLWRRWAARGRLGLGNGGVGAPARPDAPPEPVVRPKRPALPALEAAIEPAVEPAIEPAPTPEPEPTTEPAPASAKKTPGKKSPAKRGSAKKPGAKAGAAGAAGAAKKTRPPKRAPGKAVRGKASPVRGPKPPVPSKRPPPTSEETVDPDEPIADADEPIEATSVPEEDQIELEDARPARDQEPPKRSRLRRKVTTGDGDHVPLAAQTQERTGEPKILLRQRFRRGLRRTRERLGSEMREAFTGGATPEAFDRLEEALVAADVGVATTAALVDDLRQRIGLSDKTVPDALKEVMVKQLTDADRRLHLVRGQLSVWVIVGVNGTGKTTTIAKLAARARDLGLPVSMAAADTFRAAAVEQLAEWGRRLQIDVVKQDQGADPGAVVFDALAHAKANGKRLLIVDTAGRLHTRKPLMDELQKVFRVIERDEGSVIAETLLVIDATTGQNGIAQAKAFKDAVPVTGLALAKLDGSAKGGITFAVERELGVPVKAVGIGESEKDLVPFDPQTFVEALVGDE